jgi:CHAD domain-containing protein
MSKALSLFAVQPGSSLADNAPLMLYTRLSEVLHFADYIHRPENVQQLHSMRIAAKRLRYTLEIFAPAFDRRSSEYLPILNAVKVCQERIGDIHDCDIRIVQLEEYLNQNVVKKPEIRTGLQNLIARERATRETLYSEFVVFWNELSKDRKFEKEFIDVVFSSRIKRPAQAPRTKSDAAPSFGK